MHELKTTAGPQHLQLTGTHDHTLSPSETGCGRERNFCLNCTLFYRSLTELLSGTEIEINEFLREFIQEIC